MQIIWQVLIHKKENPRKTCANPLEREEAEHGKETISI